MTSEEIDLRDKIALEAMKVLMTYEKGITGLQKSSELHDATAAALGNSAYAIANQMMRAREEMT